MLDPPAISSFAIEGKGGPGATNVVEAVVGDELTLIVGGTRLADVKLRIPFAPADAFSDVAAVSATATELTPFAAPAQIIAAGWQPVTFKATNVSAEEADKGRQWLAGTRAR